MKKIASYFIVATIAGLTAVIAYKTIEKKNYEQLSFEERQNFHFTANSTNKSNATDFTQAAEKSVNGVVHIKSTFQAQQQSRQQYDPFRDFFFDFGPRMQPRQQQPQQASGSGVIISEDGYIVTNNHVIKDATEVEVTLNNKKTYAAKVVGTDPTTDLALLKIEDKDLPFIRYANSDDVKVGEWVLAVGNPFNLTSTVTAGIVSAKGRNINILDSKFAIESFIQTDAAVNPGNSGGALVNTNGELVGINTAIQSNTGSYTGYSFAVPVNIVKKVMDDLLKFGAVQRAFLGVSIRELDSKLAEEKGIDLIDGVYVAELSEGGSADDAGIKKGDIITHVAGKKVKTVPELQEQVSRYRPGDKISIQLKRDGKSKDLNLTLKSKDNDTKIVKKEKNETLLLLGAELEQISEKDKEKLDIKNGMKITKLLPGKLRSAGIKEGFIIRKIDHKTIASKEDVKKALDGKKGGVLIEGIYLNGTEAFYGFGL